MSLIGTVPEVPSMDQETGLHAPGWTEAIPFRCTPGPRARRFMKWIAPWMWTAPAPGLV